MKPTARGLESLLIEIRACRICEEHLPHGPRPVVRADHRSRILVVGQAPGRRVHDSGLPFDDPSGDRLRAWMGVDRDTFYDTRRIAVIPMGFCYPGTGRSGDLPPRPECAPAWREPLLAQLPRVELTLVIGQYALAYHLPGPRRSVARAVGAWKEHWPDVIPLPHPSPRNIRWFARNPWFEADVVPVVRRRVAELL